MAANRAVTYLEDKDRKGVSRTMEFLDSLQGWIKGTALYNDFLVHMPAPLNNIYFDTILLAVLIAYGIYRVYDIIQMSKRHKAVKERQLELKEKNAENEIHIINHEREARNQREEMSQFMRFMEMSMLAGTTKQLQAQAVEQKMPTFEQFKEREKQVKVEENHEKTHEAFETVDADQSSAEDKNSSVYDVAMTEFTQLENERMAAELNALRIENEQMKIDFAKKDAERENAVSKVKAAMAKKESEKQAEIDKLSKALSDEVSNSQKQIEVMTKNLNAYKANKEKEIADLKSKMLSGSDADRDEKQAEIDRLTAEMNSMKSVQEKAISQKENEMVRELQMKEKQIADLTDEISDIKSKNKSDIDKLTTALQSAHEAQKAVEKEKAVEIEQLTVEINRLQHTKEAEIAALKAENNKNIAALQVSLDAAKNKADEISKASQQRDKKLAALQSRLSDTEATNNSEYKALEQQIELLRKQRDDAMADKKAADAEIATLNNKLDEVKASSQKQIAAKQAEIEQLASAKAAEKVVAVPVKDATVKEVPDAKEKAIAKVASTTTPAANAKRVELPKSVVKPVFGSATKAGSNFDKVMADYMSREAKTQEMEDNRKSNEEKARSNKEALEQKLVVDAIDENTKEVHAEDEDKLTAIDEQKRRALEQAKREEERAKSGKKRIGFPFGKK